MVLPFIVCASGVAAAAPRESPAVDARTLPSQCRASALVPDDARTLGPTVEATISTASCLATVRLRALRIAPTATSVQQINEAIRPSLALLEAVIATADARSRALARHAEADLFEGIAVRLRSAVPRLAPRAMGPALTQHARTVELAALLARPWRERAVRAYRDVVRVAEAIPDAGQDDPVIGFALGDSRFEEVHAVASR